MPPLKNYTFINRELSWLQFNRRVLDQANNLSLPLLERVKFLAITASNLDEFFMVRVASLQQQIRQLPRARDNCGMTAAQQLKAVRDEVIALLEMQYHCLHNVLRPSLEKEGIGRRHVKDLNKVELAQLRELFNAWIEPEVRVATTDSAQHQAGHVPALRLGVLAKLTAPMQSRPYQLQAAADDKNKGKDKKARSPARFVALWLGAETPRFLEISSGEGTFSYVLAEDALMAFLPHFFPAETVVSTACFRISRSSDVLIEENAPDFAEEMADMLEARRQTPTIRLEITQGVASEMVAELKKLANIPAADSNLVYHLPGELDLKSYFYIAGLKQFPHLKVEPWPVTSSARFVPDEKMLDVIGKEDVLLYHPYESFDPVTRFVEEAATDPQVIAIKQVLYRTAKNSRIVAALVKAANNGKDVTVLVELKARFDEARNLDRADDLLDAGAHIIYGVRGLKTHAKICLVIRREKGRIRRYMHFGTGNYNEATANLYTDISYFTARADYGMDAAGFFNTLAGLTLPPRFQQIAMAPFGLRAKLVAMIESETTRAQNGMVAEIDMKMNSLQDTGIITKLYEASGAGVKIRLNIRGICCLRPGVKGQSDNIIVISTVDRYLEHARIYRFHQGGEPVIFISSADCMVRNLDKRVELLIPVEDPAAREELLHVLDVHFQETRQGKMLTAQGDYITIKATAAQSHQAQEYFSRYFRKQSQRPITTSMLVPHVPPTVEILTTLEGVRP